MLTIGAYDGLHRGHMSVITSVVNEAKARSARSVVITFDRHPASVVRPESAPLLITSLEERIEVLAHAGLDAVVVLPFDESAARENAADFVQRVFVDALAAEVVIVGEDFHFGKGREGNVPMLHELGAVHDFVVSPIVLHRDDHDVISSTAIRQALRNGDIDRASSMLGRPVRVHGEVIHGDERGRTIGFPTANIDAGPGVAIPADGVYAARCTVDGKAYRCAVNIGRRPTFYEAAGRSLIECHLLDFDGDLYGRTLAIEIIGRLRDEQRFEGLSELTAQLALDVEAARQMVKL